MNYFISDGFPELEIESRKSNPTGRTVFGYITLGTEGESGGFGFYNWNPSPLATNSLALSSDEKTLTVTIDARLLEYRQPDMLKYLEGKNTVAFAEGWKASEEVNKSLGASKPVVVRPGKYSVICTGEVYILTFVLVPPTINGLLHSLTFTI